MGVLRVQAGLADRSLKCASKAGRLLPQHFLSGEMKGFFKTQQVPC